MEKEIIGFNKNGLPIKIYNSTMQKNRNFRGIHSHMAIEIVEVISGVLNCYINGQTVYAYPKQVVLINSNVGHKLFSDNAKITYTQINDRFFRENKNYNEFNLLFDFIIHNTVNQYLIFSNDTELNGILERIKSKYYDNNEYSRWYLRAYIYELMAFMHSHSFIAPSIPATLKTEKIESIVRYINDNYTLPITLADISDNVKYSKCTICHTFKEITGSTVFEYINYLRVQHAVEKMKQEDSVVFEVAIESGFSSSAYFNRVFKCIMGCSPSVYKKILDDNIQL